MRIFDEIKIGLAQATALLEVKNRLSAKEMAELEEIIKEKNLCELINKNNLLEELSLKLGYVDINKEKFEQKINYITAASTMPIDEINNSEVTVGEVLVISDMKVVLEVGSTKIISVVQIPKDYKVEDIVCASSNDAIATVNKEGIVTAVSEGSAVITVSTKDKKYNACLAVTVIDPNKKEFEPLKDFKTVNYYFGNSEGVLI